MTAARRTSAASSLRHRARSSDRPNVARARPLADLVITSYALLRIDGDQYADSMSTGDFGRSRYDDLAVADVGMAVSRDGYGAVSVLYGTSSGLTPQGDQLWTVQRLGRTSPRSWAERLADR